MRIIMRTMTAAFATVAMFSPAMADIKLGVAAAYGQPYLSGAQAAADKINAAGGVLGEKLVVVSATTCPIPSRV